MVTEDEAARGWKETESHVPGKFYWQLLAKDPRVPGGNRCLIRISDVYSKPHGHLGFEVQYYFYLPGHPLRGLDGTVGYIEETLDARYRSAEQVRAHAEAYYAVANAARKLGAA